MRLRSPAPYVLYVHVIARRDRTRGHADDLAVFADRLPGFDGAQRDLMAERDGFLDLDANAFLAPAPHGRAAGSERAQCNGDVVLWVNYDRAQPFTRHRGPQKDGPRRASTSSLSSSTSPQVAPPEATSRTRSSSRSAAASIGSCPARTGLPSKSICSGRRAAVSGCALI